MSQFAHERHKPLATLKRERELVVACAPMRTNVNLSRIIRAAGCSGVRRIVCCGHVKVIDKIARDSLSPDSPTGLALEVHRTLPPALERLRSEGFQLVGLEQVTGSQCLYAFPFVRKTVLVIGNERLGLEEDVLRMLDHVVEIPVYGLPYAHNVATAAAMALYEYCRQFPDG
jgi:tRNA G18 (ribose-2'-O)-methylase SpoU